MSIEVATDVIARDDFPQLDIIPRDSLLHELVHELERDSIKCVLMVGDPGVGKRALLYLLSTYLGRSQCPSPLRAAPVLLASTEDLLSDNAPPDFLELSLYNLGAAPSLATGGAKPIVCIPNVHKLIAKGVDPNSLPDWLLAPANKWIITLSTEEYQRYFANRSKWRSSAFKMLVVPELSEEETVALVLKRRDWIQAQFDVALDRQAVRLTVELSKEHLGGFRRPGIVLDILEEACKDHRGKTVGKTHVSRVISERIGYKVGPIEAPPDPRPPISATRPGAPPPPSPSQTPSPRSDSLVARVLEFVREVDRVASRNAPGVPSVCDKHGLSSSEEPDPDQLRAALDELQQRLVAGEGRDGTSDAFATRLEEFVYDVDRATSRTLPDVASVTDQFGVGAMCELETDQLRRALDALLQRLEWSEGEFPHHLVRNFAMDVDRYVVGFIHKNASFLLDNTDRLPDQPRPLRLIFPEDSRAKVEAQKLQAYLDSLCEWLEVIETAVKRATGQCFKEMRSKLDPPPVHCSHDYQRLFTREMDQISLMAAWREEIRKVLRKAGEDH